jgi:hypothetical protein
MFYIPPEGTTNMDEHLPTLAKWVLGILTTAIGSGGIWVGSIQAKVTRNEEDLVALKKVPAEISGLQATVEGQTLMITEMHKKLMNG